MKKEEGTKGTKGISSIYHHFLAAFCLNLVFPYGLGVPIWLVAFSTRPAPIQVVRAARVYESVRI